MDDLNVNGFHHLVNIYCILEIVQLDISKLNGLSLVVGISIARVLKKYYLDAKLKWPDDIYVDDKKIAGIIINVSAEINGRAKLFIGFGININMQYNEQISKKWTSMKLQSQRHANRTNLTIRIIKAIKETSNFC
ncbi:biotin--[acetyl-CoA-carboxylase] ligase [Francisella noatunensis]